MILEYDFYQWIDCDVQLWFLYQRSKIVLIILNFQKKILRKSLSLVYRQKPLIYILELCNGNWLFTSYTYTRVGHLKYTDQNGNLIDRRDFSSTFKNTKIFHKRFYTREMVCECHDYGEKLGSFLRNHSNLMEFKFWKRWIDQLCSEVVLEMLSKLVFKDNKQVFWCLITLLHENYSKYLHSKWFLIFFKITLIPFRYSCFEG